MLTRMPNAVLACCGLRQNSQGRFDGHVVRASLSARGVAQGGGGEFTTSSPSHCFNRKAAVRTAVTSPQSVLHGTLYRVPTTIAESNSMTSMYDQSTIFHNRF